MFILITAALILFGIKTAPKGEYFSDSFSVGQTRALKGIFAIVVIFHHLYGVLLPSFLSIKYFRDLGFLMVGGFFLISGYGLMYGVKNKKNYLKGFFFKRILAIVIPYYVIDSFYVIMRYMNTTDMDAFKVYLKESLMGLQFWFVPVMVLLYVLFRVSFIGHEKRENKLISPLLLTFLTLAYVVLFTLTQQTGHNLLYGCEWNDTVLCFTVGMWYCILKERLAPVLMKHYYVFTAVIAVLFAVSFVLVMKLPPYVWPTSPYRLTLRIAASVLFCGAVLLLSMKIKLGNKVINACGDLSFELYMSHAIFIKVFRYGTVWLFGHYVPLVIENDFVYVAAILVTSFVFSFVIHKLCGLLLKPLQRLAKK